MNKQTRQIDSLTNPETAIHRLASLTEVNHCNAMAVNKAVPTYISQNPGLSLASIGNCLYPSLPFSSCFKKTQGYPCQNILFAKTGVILH